MQTVRCLNEIYHIFGKAATISAPDFKKLEKAIHHLEQLAKTYLIYDIDNNIDTKGKI